jgi:hypothetical protein
VVGVVVGWLGLLLRWWSFLTLGKRRETSIRRRACHHAALLRMPHSCREMHWRAVPEGPSALYPPTCLRAHSMTSFRSAP